MFVCLFENWELYIFCADPLRDDGGNRLRQVIISTHPLQTQIQILYKHKYKYHMNTNKNINITQIKIFYRYKHEYKSKHKIWQVFFFFFFSTKGRRKKNCEKAVRLTALGGRGGHPSWLPNSTDLYFWYLFVDQHRNTNMNDKDHLVGQLTRVTPPPARPFLFVKMLTHFCPI